MSKHQQQVAKERIRQARQSGKSEMARNLMEYYYFADTIKYFEAAENKKVDTKK